MKLEFSRQIFEKYSNVNLMKIRTLGAELFHADDRRTDRYDEANSRFSQFCERAHKLNFKVQGVEGRGLD